jgi:hypothetical protein
MSEIETHTRNFLFQLHVTWLNVIRYQSQDWYMDKINRKG